MSVSWSPPDGLLPGQRGAGGDAVASGETLDQRGEAERVVGRVAERARLGRLLEAARSGSADAVVIEGEAGTGKTTLLRAAAAQADGFVRVTVRGVESENVLAHACLLELLAPLRRHLADVPLGQAQALSAALGWCPVHTSGDRYLVAAGTLSMLAAAAEAAPLLVLVDDMQWIDPESSAALLFAARRMHQDRVAFVLAQRPGARHPLEGVDVMSLGDLSVAGADELLTPDLARSVVHALVARIGGNPLALLEVAASLDAAQRRGAAPLPRVLPLGRALADVFKPQLDAVSTDARRALLLLAAAHDDSASHVGAALQLSAAAAEDALDELEQCRLAVRHGDSLSFRHPLVRSQVWHLATAQQRRAAHRALADTARAGDVVTRTWHRAQATVGPDDELADELVTMADWSRSRSGFAASSAALERAAALTTDAGRAARRLAAAVTDTFVSGDMGRTRALAKRVLHGQAPASARGEALHALGVLEQSVGSVGVARDLLREAADAAEGGPRIWSLAELALTQHRLSDVPGLLDTVERVAATPPGGPAEQALVPWIAGAAQIHAGQLESGRTLVRRALDVMEREPSLRDEPRLLIYVMLGASWLDDVLEAVPRVARRMRAARERGALGVLVPALAMSAYGRARFLGDHVGAFADAGEAVELAAQLGYVADAAPAIGLLAWEYAARGRHDEARRQLDRASSLAGRAGTAELAARLAVTAAFCALCRGDLGDAAQLLEARIAEDGGVGPVGEPLGVAPLLVEAYAGLRRSTDAAALAARYAEVSHSPLPPTAALVARCRALASADDDAALAAFEESLTFHALAPDRFEAARTRLLYGARLRRSGRRTAAREQLRVAADQFAAMDLVLWAQRADTELQATGRSARPRRPLPEEPLTSQETRVARSAAQGLSNREIAATLFLSPKTVEHHLSSVYRKRGLRSRVQLANVFRAESDGAHRTGP
jgi:DNA-binding CsgD family transcriptional regulator/tetratricopeptide (TPR) repeat protein